MTQFVNFLLYQIGWFACVLGAAWGLPWWGACLAGCLAGVHFWLAADRAVQFKLALFAAAVGWVIDGTQLWLGVFRFPHGSLLPWLPPPFLTVLWIQFASTLRYSMRWLGGRYLLSGLLGLAGAPLAFFAGERLGAIEFLPPRLLHYAVLGVLWSGCVPLLVSVADRLAAGTRGWPEYRGFASSVRPRAARHAVERA